ncbi:hypothetical protein [Bradyrhizobium sp. 199]|uniref:hypothetical protein n=1 Tax=Bradyrhizobium sp. 199 TaxID=2782664 RepID=UPI001FF7BA69|nr:hypothetical protein [Bradyrhizobium sp. 199]MCK1361661.1 hypothetical protein [Bradyrhizobium sp. 199]
MSEETIVSSRDLFAEPAAAAKERLVMIGDHDLDDGIRTWPRAVSLEISSEIVDDVVEQKGASGSVASRSSAR